MRAELPTVYLARHGETEWSKSGQHTGRTDIPLTAAGESDGRRLGTRFAGLTFGTVLTSPLSRARRTAELAGFPHAVPDPDIMEWSYGEYEGLKTAEIRQRNSDWNLFRDGAPGGESPADVVERVDRFIGKLRGLTGNVLVFAHGHLLRVVGARWVGQPLPFAAHLLLGTAGVCILGFDHHDPDEPAIALWNDSRHLS